MAGSSRYIRSEAGEIERRLRTLERLSRNSEARHLRAPERLPAVWLTLSHRFYQTGRHVSATEQTR